MEKIYVEYGAGQSWMNPDKTVDYMFAIAPLADGDKIKLHAELENETWDEEAEDYGDETATYDELKAAILEQARDAGVDPDTLRFQYDDDDDEGEDEGEETVSPWIALIKEHRAALAEAITDAHREMLTHYETEGIYSRVVLWEDGDITTMIGHGGGDAHYAAEETGRALCIATIEGWGPDDWEEWLEAHDGDVSATIDEYTADDHFDPNDLIDEALDREENIF